MRVIDSEIKISMSQVEFKLISRLIGETSKSWLYEHGFSESEADIIYALHDDMGKTLEYE